MSQSRQLLPPHTHGRRLKRGSRPSATWAVVLLAVTSLSTSRCEIQSTRAWLLVRECWWQQKELDPREDTSIQLAGFAIFCSDANRITRTGLLTARMRSERRCALR